MARLRASAAIGAAASVALSLGVALPASAGTGTGAPASSQPTWWQKFQTISAPEFTPLGDPGNGSGLVEGWVAEQVGVGCLVQEGCAGGFGGQGEGAGEPGAVAAGALALVDGQRAGERACGGSGGSLS